MSDKNFETILGAWTDSHHSCELCKISVIHANTYLYNSAGYLVPLNEVREIARAAAQYLSSVTEEEVVAYNNWLRDKRIKKSSGHRGEKKEPAKTFIYLLFNRRNGYYKIGRAKVVEFREKTLQAEEPDIELICSFPGTSTVEKNLHQLYHEKRIRGEWFQLSEDDVSHIKSLGEPK